MHHHTQLTHGLFYNHFSKCLKSNMYFILAKYLRLKLRTFQEVQCNRGLKRAQMFGPTKTGFSRTKAEPEPLHSCQVSTQHSQSSCFLKPLLPWHLLADQVCRSVPVLGTHILIPIPETLPRGSTGLGAVYSGQVWILWKHLLCPPAPHALLVISPMHR